MDSREPMTEYAEYSPDNIGLARSTVLEPRLDTGYRNLSATCLGLYTEKLEGLGEDAPPLAEQISGDSCLVGVFDGLGGAGATRIQTDEGERTSAFVASRLAREQTRSALSRALSLRAPRPLAHGEAAGQPRERLVTQLTDTLRESFRRTHARTGDSGSRIRSGLLRPLPTTLAVALVSVRPDDVGVHVFWAGDSRIYMLLPDSGLHQLTVDDLKSGGDAMQNLHEDSPMSNVVSADGRFVIRHHHLNGLPNQVAVIAASDGCFNFLSTPLHFEDLLLSAMQEAARRGGHWNEWRSELRRRILEVTKDDATIGLACLGWNSFGDMARRFEHRQEQTAARARVVDAAAAEQARADAAAQQAKAAHQQAKAALWSWYRVSYEELLHELPAPESPAPRPALPVGPPPEGAEPRAAAAPEESGAPAPPGAEPPDARSGSPAKPAPTAEPDHHADPPSAPEAHTEHPADPPLPEGEAGGHEPNPGPRDPGPVGAEPGAGAKPSGSDITPHDDLTAVAAATKEEKKSILRSTLRGGRDSRTRHNHEGDT